VIGNGLKAGVRFFSYEKFKKALVDQDVCDVILSCICFVKSAVIELILSSFIIAGKTYRSTVIISRTRSGDVRSIDRSHSLGNDQNKAGQ
jgi:hypothetical protein